MDIFSEIENNPTYIPNILESFYVEFYDPEKIDLYNPAEGLIIYLLKEHDHNMSIVSLIIEKIVEKLYSTMIK